MKPPASPAITARFASHRVRLPRGRWLRHLLPLCVLLGMSGCASAATSQPPSEMATAAVMLTPTLPAFSEWRVAYLSALPLGIPTLHAILPNGTQDLVGPALPGFGGAFGLITPSVSPDGHFVAYQSSGGLMLVDLTGHLPLRAFPRIVPFSMAWSPDSTTLAVSLGDHNVLIHMADGMLRQVPDPAGGRLSNLLGWADNTHIVGNYFPNPTPLPSNVTPTEVQSGTPPSAYGPQTLPLDIQDVTTGALHHVASITSAAMGQGYFTLSPDGRTALFYNRRFRDTPYTPYIQLIDMTSGAVRPLPNIGRIASDGFTALAWLPSTMTLASSTGFDVNGNLKSWLLDVGQDTARQLPYTAYPEGWTPDSHVLILSSTYEAQDGEAPITITAVSGALSGPGTATILASSAETFPILGVVRTA